MEKPEQIKPPTEPTDKFSSALNDVLNEVRALAKDPKRSDALLSLEIQKLVDYGRELGEDSSSLQEHLDKLSQEWWRENQRFVDEYETYRIDAIFTRKLSEAINRIEQAHIDIDNEKNEKIKENEIKEKLPPGITDLKIIKNEKTQLNPLINSSEVDHYNLGELVLEFKLNNIKIQLFASEILIKGYGQTLAIDELRLDNIPIKIIQKDIFDSRASSITEITNEFKNLTENQKTNATLIFSPHLNRILLPSNIEQDKSHPYPTYEKQKNEITVISTDQKKLYKETFDEKKSTYRVFSKSGELIPSFEEFAASNKDDTDVKESYMKMLAKELDSDEMLNIYMRVMFSYKNDTTSLQYYTDSTNFFDTTNNSSFDNWQSW